MEDAYGIGITNRYDFLLDTDANDPQAILKQKAKKAKKAAKKLGGKENSENEAKVETKQPEKGIDEKKVKFVVPGKGVSKQLQQGPPAQKSRSMKDTQNIQDNGNTENEMNNGNGFRETKNNFDRERNNYGNNRNFENRENREQRNNRRNRDGGTDTNDAGYRTYQDNGNGPPSNRNYRPNRNNDYRNTFNNENTNNGQDTIEYNNQRDQRDNDRPLRRQGGYDRNFGNRDGGNRRYDGQRRNFDGRGGKREFDRQSGSDKTGVKAVEKREGGGAHNWGTHKQDIEDLNKNGTELDLKEDGGNSVEIEKSEENLVVEQPVYTLDEYKKLRGERAKPVYNTRKAGEGEDKKKYKNMIPLQKKNDDAKEEDEYEYDPTLYPQRKRNIKSINDVIKVCFNESKRIGNNNNNNDRRRRNRDFNGRKSDEANRQNAPQIDDRNFPSLG